MCFLAFIPGKGGSGREAEGAGLLELQYIFFGEFYLGEIHIWKKEVTIKRRNSLQVILLKS